MMEDLPSTPTTSPRASCCVSLCVCLVALSTPLRLGVAYTDNLKISGRGHCKEVEFKVAVVSPHVLRGHGIEDPTGEASVHTCQ
jgi:hypothetical protein